MKYYRVTVTLKNGFKYSYTCIGKMLEGMKAASQGFWTEKVEVVEITKEDHFKTREVSFTEDKVLRKAIVKSSKVVDKGFLQSDITTEKKVRAKKSDKTEKPVKLESGKATTLEDFFDEPRPSIPTKETSRNKKADTLKKVSARKQT